MCLQLKPLNEAPRTPVPDGGEGPELGRCLLSFLPDCKLHVGRVSVLVKSVKSLRTPLTPRMSHEVEADMPWGTLGRALPPTEGGPGRQRPGWTPLSQQQGPGSTCSRPHLRSPPCFPMGCPSSLSPRGWQRHLHLAVWTPALPCHPRPGGHRSGEKAG